MDFASHAHRNKLDLIRFLLPVARYPRETAIQTNPGSNVRARREPGTGEFLLDWSTARGKRYCAQYSAKDRSPGGGVAVTLVLDLNMGSECSPGLFVQLPSNSSFTPRTVDDEAKATVSVEPCCLTRKLNRDSSPHVSSMWA